jgi:hypothetical protein
MSDADSDAEREDDDGRKYERSSIAFPYVSLKDAEEIANSLHASWGDDADLDQLAHGMGTTKTSGTFRSKLATARTFGVIQGTRGRAKLTPLGVSIVDPTTAPAARVDAFLNVPLFKSLYEKHKTGTVPPDEGLENEIRELGVSSRQTDRARQAFQRSAEQAGFFALGKDRLTMPNVGNTASGNQKKDPTDKGGKMEPMRHSTLSPAVADLLATLLTDGADWPPEKVSE